MFSFEIETLDKNISTKMAVVGIEPRSPKALHYNVIKKDHHNIILIIIIIIINRTENAEG